MRRTALAIGSILATTLLGATPAHATGAEHSGLQHDLGWEPAPSAPWDVAAGHRCDFAIHGEPVVDEVVQRVLARYPDGSPKSVAYRGDLVVRVTNKVSDVFYDADASGSAIVEYRADGSQFWSVLGPVLVGVGEGNLDRGMYVVDGVYTLAISASGHKTVTMAHGSTTDICERIS
ncbi:hypothetical protein [Streptomyces sp. NBC_00887]|uniref:hypothetical protein n=1 Tax=Streptomyces sp. NBC_00887 TaxID=2975859 RepID=UPI00386AD6F6|nr:hypothetical protein OG844_03735 [Streptomyces sp. NBC_00887]WSY35795.1 hypothetical protein OG844_41865 [Streptomyces sp. NBC_00887]